jgi:23S rRNA (adenine2503-C2)-methyltransferase
MNQLILVTAFLAAIALWHYPPRIWRMFRDRTYYLSRTMCWFRCGDSLLWIESPGSPPRFSERHGYKKPLLRILGWRLFYKRSAESAGKGGWMNYEVMHSSDSNVFKYIFTWEDAVAEAVLYRYGSFDVRTVICCSVQSGCPVGCTFCGTGNQFVRNLTADEIVGQVQTVLADKGLSESILQCRKFQIMFMSMGEPMLNWSEVRKAILELNLLYPAADLLVSTVGVNNAQIVRDLVKVSHQIPKVGLQFSIHRSTDEERAAIIPYKRLLSLRLLRDIGIGWWGVTGRRVYLNYCLDGSNSSSEDANRLMELFSPTVFNFTFSVLCSPSETMKDAGYRNIEEIQKFELLFRDAGYDTRLFDPAGQDDIGGGCGMLWFVQRWLQDFQSKRSAESAVKGEEQC